MNASRPALKTAARNAIYIFGIPCRFFLDHLQAEKNALDRRCAALPGGARQPWNAGVPPLAPASNAA